VLGLLTTSLLLVVVVAVVLSLDITAAVVAGLAVIK
jgi:hypothetical protein